MGINSQAEADAVSAQMDALWCVFDSDGSGEIDEQEFLQQVGP